MRTDGTFLRSQKRLMFCMQLYMEILLEIKWAVSVPASQLHRIQFEHMRLYNLTFLPNNPHYRPANFKH